MTTKFGRNILNKNFIYHNINNYFLFWLIIISIVYLHLRNTGLYPMVFADEYSYSKFSRLLPLSESTIPDYVYFFVYRATYFFGDHFLAAARTLNVLFFVATSPFIYLTAKRFTTPKLAQVITLLSILGPLNIYTTFFMPESFYFFSFWVLAWYALGLDASSPLKSWMLLGLITGLSALIKPHTLFLLPAISIYILYVGIKPEGKWFFLALLNAGIFVLVAFVTKLLIGYALAGTPGVTLFGSFYAASTANLALSSADQYGEFLTKFSVNLKGHILALSLTYGLPIAIAVHNIFKVNPFKQDIENNQKISFFSLILLFNLIFVVSLFTASIAGSGPSETIGRLHTRYYYFTFPLLLIVAGTSLNQQCIDGISRLRFFYALPIGLLSLYAAYVHLAPYVPKIMDCPELVGFWKRRGLFYFFSFVSFMSLTVWIYSLKSGVKVFIYFFMPLVVFASSICTNIAVRKHIYPSVFDRAGCFTKQYLSNEQLSKVIVVGYDHSGLFRALFHIDNSEASLELLPQGTSYDLSKLPQDKEWVLFIKADSWPKNHLLNSGDGFTLRQARETNPLP